jgi:WD40 repeat protein
MEAPSSAPPRVEARRSPRVAPGATAGVSAHTPRRRARRSAALPQHLLARSDTGRNTSAQRALLGFNPQQIADLWRVLPPALVDTDRPGRASLPRLHGDDSLLHRGCVNAAAWNQSGTLLCTGSDDRRVKIWDAGRDFALAEGGTIKTGHRRNIFHVSFVAAASDRQILSCGADGQLRLSDVTAGSEAEHGRLLCDEGDGMMFMFEWMPRVPVVLTAQEDGTVHRVDLREPRPEQLFANPRGAVKALAFGHHSEHILAAGGDGACVKLYDVRKLGTSASAAQALVCSCVPDGLSRVDAAAHGGRLQMGSAEDSISISGLK